MKIKTNFKRIFSGILSLTMMSTLLPYLPANAETLDEKYPYTLFAGSSEEGAITINADNIGINGNVATNGSIVSTANNFNVNGTKTEYAEEEMIYCFKKLDYAYFTGTNVNFYADDYSYEDTNININTPLDVGGEIELTGNINLNTGIKAVEDVTLNGDVKNTNESVICSETGDIIIETNNVNLNGLVYAPEGCVEITAQNLNMNNVVIIADTIIINCPNLNANYSNSMAEFVGTESEVELEMFAFAQYTADTNTINIEWSSTVPKGTFDIQISDDNITYTSIGTVTNDTCYDYGITEEFEKRYFKITETTYYGEVGSSIPFVAVKTTEGYEIQLLDTEEDGVPDIFENMYGTDINNPDTDKDNLTDYEEIYLTNSDPTVYNSVNENLSDADADSDEDGISNIEEIKLETNPLLPDTDSDDISDYDELYIYFTDPLNPDTDDDTISDGDELKLGLDPSNPQTFGIPDAEYKTTQNISADSETLSDINTEENPYKLSIDITAAGYAPNSMDASISGYTNTLSDNSSIIGNVVSLEYINTSYENVTLNFEIDSAYLNNMEDSVTENLDLEGINRLHVFRYDKEYNILYPVETTINNNTLTVNTSELGDYCIVDLDAWLNLLGIELTATETYDIAPASAEIEVYSEETVNPESTDEVVVVDETVPENYEELVEENIEEAIAQIAEDTPSVAAFSLEDTSTILSAKHKIDLVYVIDTSGSMGGVLSTAKASMSNLVNSLNAAGIDVNVAVISYDDYLMSSSTTKTYYTSTFSPWANTPEDASYLINQVYITNGGWENPLDGLGMAHKLNYHPNATKFMVLITDEPCESYYNRYDITSMQEMADMLKADDIYTSVICYDRLTSDYAPLYTTTNGININLSSDWVIYLEEYIRTYIRDLKTFKAVVPNSLTTISLNEAPVFGAEVNSDEDSLWDYEEIDWECIFEKNSVSILPHIKPDNSELILPTLNEYLIYTYNTNPFDNLHIAKEHRDKINSIVVLPLKSNPLKEDSDNDGFLDGYADDLDFQGYKYAYSDPNPFENDVTEINLKNDFFSVTYEYLEGTPDNWVEAFYNIEDTEITKCDSYGGYQTWCGHFGTLSDAKIFCNNTKTGKDIANDGCGLIATADTFMYMAIDNPKYNPVSSKMELGTSYKNIKFKDYLSYVQYVSDYFPQLPVMAIGPESLSQNIDLINTTNNMNLHCWWCTFDDKSYILTSIENMLKDNIPVIYSYYTLSEKCKLPLFQLEAGKYTSKRRPLIKSHYMVATGLLTYSEDVSPLIGHEIMLKTATYGEEYYVDYNTYSQSLGLATNIFVINKGNLYEK